MSGLLLAAAVLIAAAEPCALEGGRDDPFALSAPAEGGRVHVIVEVRLTGSPPGWAERVLAALEANDARGTVVVAVGRALSEAEGALLTAATERGHEVAARLEAGQVPTDTLARLGPSRALLRPLKAAVGPVRTVTAPIETRASEALLGRLGFRTLLPDSSAAVATGRMAGVFEGQPRVNVVLPSGPYSGPCGRDPAAAPLTPGAADRVTEALFAAARAGGAPVVRMVLGGESAGEDDAHVLGRWLAEVATPAGVRVVPASDARAASLRAFRSGDTAPPDGAPAGGGRLVALDEVRGAASALADVQTVPRVLPGDLVPTEAFYAFMLFVAEQTEQDLVRLGALEGPSMLAQTGLSGRTPVRREALVELAKALLAGMPAELPAALSVDGQLLTTSELLLALASAVRGEDPPTTWPVAVPEPNARGLGWGSATLP